MVYLLFAVILLVIAVVPWGIGYLSDRYTDYPYMAHWITGFMYICMAAMVVFIIVGAWESAVYLIGELPWT